MSKDKESRLANQTPLLPGLEQPDGKRYQYGAEVVTHCRECGDPLVPVDAHYSVCPHGHGRLAARTTKGQQHREWLAALPQATRSIGATFTIEGHTGLFRYLNGQQAITCRSRLPQAAVGARIITKKGRVYARAFIRANGGKRRGKSQSATC